jgi:uncharacterized protein YndB with AHSA1/START domain
MIQDTIERQMTFSVSQARVWAALTEPAQLTRWFGTRAEFNSLTPGAPIVFGWDDYTTRGVIVEVDPPRRFAYRWQSHAADPQIPLDELPTTLVTFTLETMPAGTQLTVIESGFAALPTHLQQPEYAENSSGWTAELADLRAYLEAAA